jgi:hypothetical protein
MQADGYLEVRSLAGTTAVSHRLARVESYSPRIRLQEAILVGNSHGQVKFGELSLDLFRVMQVRTSGATERRLEVTTLTLDVDTM